MKEFSKSDIDIKEWEFEFQQRNKSCILMADLHCRGLFEQLPSEIKLDIEPYDYIFADSDKGYVKRQKKKDLLNKLRTALEDDEYLSYVIRNSTKRMTEFGEVINEINLKIKSEISSNEISHLWKIFCNAYIKMMPWFYIPWYVSEENILTDKVREGLKKHQGIIENLDEAFLQLIFPVKKASFQKEQELFLELVENIEKGDYENDIFKAKVKKYLEEFGWRPTFFFLPIDSLNENELINNIHHAIKNNYKQAFQANLKKQAQDKQRVNELLELLKDDKQLVKDINSARELGWALTAGVEDAHKYGSFLKPLLKKVSDVIEISIEDIQYLTAAEIQQALDEKKKINHDELEKRKIGYFYANINGEVLLLSGDLGKKQSKWLDESVVCTEDGITEFIGVPASKGKVKGRVRLAATGKESHSLNTGEILVCAMTSPDYVPAMKRSAAIITDEGGLLCHAAIMSREFGKPCIISTKIATKVLKDGDLVEVDANKGIVKILKKNNK